MEEQQKERRISSQSALIYLPLSIGIALTFIIAAISHGNHPSVAIYGGAVWVGLLSLIVSMPLVTDRVKKRLR
jgi:hypothetical protein